MTILNFGDQNVKNWRDFLVVTMKRTKNVKTENVETKNVKTECEAVNDNFTILPDVA